MAKSGRLATRLVWLAFALVVVDAVELLRVLPQMVHDCAWPTAQVYGGYEDMLFVELWLSFALQLATLLVVLIWYYYDTRPAEYGAATAALFLSSSSSLDRKRLMRPPMLVYLFQSASVVVQLLLLFHLQEMILAAGLIKLALSGLMLCARILSPSALCWRAHRIHRPPGTALNADNFMERTRILVLASSVLTLLFLLLLALEYSETFASGPKFYRSAHLRLLNDDRHPFNRGLMFHEWSDNATTALQRGQLPMRRVVLVVLDGFGQDRMDASAAWTTLLRDMARQGHVWRTTLQAALPTMSAPNWLTILTGARPEITGLRGNIFPGETEFDHLMARMARLDTRTSEFARGLVSCTWWSDLIRTYMPRIRGNGVVPTYSMYDVVRRHQPLPYVEWSLSSSEQVVRPPYVVFLESYDRIDALTDDVTDRHRTELTRLALMDAIEPYRFFLLHLANIDTQGHYEGVEPAYNPKRTFERAVDQTAEAYVRSIWNTIVFNTTIAEQTLLLITADHGQVAPGGHGGTARVLRDVPFVAFRASPSSSSSSSSSSLSTSGSMDQVAPTIAAWLDLPIPRQATGHPLPLPSVMVDWDSDVLRRQAVDRYEATRERVNVFLLQLGVTEHEWCTALVPQHRHLLRNATFVRTATIQEFDRAAADLDDVYQCWRSRALVLGVVRNMGVALLLVFFLLFYFSHLMVRHTVVFVPASWKAALLALLLLALYVSVTISVVLGFYALHGYHEWDSTWVHSVGAVIRFLLITLGPGSLWMFVLVRAYHIPWLRGPSAMRIVFIETAYARGHCSSLQWVYWIRFYLTLFGFSLASVLLVLQGLYSYWFPPLTSQWFLTETTWTMRFRILTLQLTTVPLLVGNLATLCSFSRTNRHQLTFPPRPPPTIAKSNPRRTYHDSGEQLLNAFGFWLPMPPS
jgi:hypothetical protein